MNYQSFRSYKPFIPVEKEIPELAGLKWVGIKMPSFPSFFVEKEIPELAGLKS